MAKRNNTTTKIWTTKKGVDFLGYRLVDAKAKTITIAKPSLQRFYNRLHQLYEQRASLVRVKTYLDNWLRWVRGGLSQWRIILPDSVHYLINNPGNLTAYLIEHRALLGG